MTAFSRGFMKAMLLLLVWLFVGAMERPLVVHSASNVAYIGVMYSGSGSADLVSVGARTVLNLHMWQQRNAELAPGLAPVLVWCDVASNPVQAVACFYTLTQQHNISVLIAPESTLVASVAPLADAAHIPLIASVSGLQQLYVCDDQLLSPCTKAYGPRFQSLIGNGVTAQDAGLGLVSFLQPLGAATIAFVRAADAFNSAICEGIFQQAQDSRLSIVLDYVLPPDPFGNLTADASGAVVRDTIQPLDPDVVVWCARPYCKEIADAFFDAKYFPRALVCTQCLDSAYGLTPEGQQRLAYALDAALWDERMRGQDYTDDGTLPYCNNFPPISNSYTSAELYAQAFYNSTAGQATQTDAGIYAGMYIVQAAIAVAQSTNPAAVLQAISTLNIPSFKGRLQVDSNRMINWGGAVFLQLLGDTIEIVYPSSSVTANIIYPAPTFAERIDTNRPFQTSIEWAVLGLSVALCVGTAACCVVLVRLRHVPAVRALHWRWSAVTLAGVGVSNLSVLTWTVHNTQLQCDLRLWAWILGGTCMFLPLVSAFLRIYLILHNTSVRHATIIRASPLPQQQQQHHHQQQRWQLRMSRTLLVGAQWLLLVLFFALTLAWYLAAPFRLTIYTIDPIRPSLNIHECATDGWHTFGAAIAALVLVTLLLIGMTSWSIRRVQDTRFHRFRVVMIASFVWVLFLTVIALFQSTASTSVSRAFLFGMRSILLLLSNVVYVGLLFASPLYDAAQQYLASHGKESRPLPRLDVQLAPLPPLSERATISVPPHVAHVPMPVLVHGIVDDCSSTASGTKSQASRSPEHDPPPTRTNQEALVQL